MTLRFYNTLTRKKEPFQEIDKGKVRLYTCGPTVYNYAHIGNWRSFIFSDILRRHLKFKGYDIVHVMNLTDVDDKTIRDSQKEGISLQEFTERYTKYFFEDMDLLNIERVEYYPKATESIREMLEITQGLLDKGIAYKTDDGSVYYDVSDFDGYGKLSKIQFESQQSSERVKQDEYEKEEKQDFALWKGYEDSDGPVFWETEFGKGRPGWHIECSAMSMKFLGKHFDIHTGGIDLIFPHHENEIAQSEGYSGEKFVNYWLHCEHLLVEGEKMSKSKGNFYILKDILDKGHSARAVRYLLMGTHYRQQLNFTFDALEAAERSIERFQEFLRKLKSVQQTKGESITDKVKEYKDRFEDALDDDLNISKALSVVFDFMSEINKLNAQDKLSRQAALEAYNLMKEFDMVLGVMDFSQEKIPDEVMALVDQREKAREDKDWDKADALRKKVMSKGYEIEDTKEGPLVKKI